MRVGETEGLEPLLAFSISIPNEGLPAVQAM